MCRQSCLFPTGSLVGEYVTLKGKKKGLVNIRFQSTQHTAVLASAAQSDMLVLALFSLPPVKSVR